MIIKEKIREYIIKETMISKEKVKFETKIFDEGMLDSMGLLFLIEFLKKNIMLKSMTRNYIRRILNQLTALLLILKVC